MVIYKRYVTVIVLFVIHADAARACNKLVLITILILLMLHGVRIKKA